MPETMTSNLEEVLPQTFGVIQAGMERGLHLGVQLYVSLNRHVVVDSGIGFDEPNRELTNDFIMLWLSAGKPLTAVMILQLVDEGKIGLDTVVGEVIPEFAINGKRSISIKHLLTHTGGFRNVDMGWPDASHEETLQRICSASLEDGWVVGDSAGYHLASSWFILGEILQRIDQKPFAQCLQERICSPLNMASTSNGISSSEFAEIEHRIGKMYQIEKGELSLHDWHDKRACEKSSPGAACRGPIRELGWFYESFLPDENSSARLLSPATNAEFTQRARVGTFDQTLRHKVDFGLGVIVNSNRYGVDTVPYGYGEASSESTFGHGGSQSSLGFCDPERGLVVAYVANTRVGEGRHQRRNREIVNAIYSDMR
jgi:CubicO group peptidase (beta-lactamase class C family)